MGKHEFVAYCARLSEADRSAAKKQRRMEKNRQSAQLSQQRKRTKTSADEAEKKRLATELRQTKAALAETIDKFLGATKSVTPLREQLRNAIETAALAQISHQMTVLVLQRRAIIPGFILAKAPPPRPGNYPCTAPPTSDPSPALEMMPDPLGSLLD